jgi:hypothetical protein
LKNISVFFWSIDQHFFLLKKKKKLVQRGKIIMICWLCVTKFQLTFILKYIQCRATLYILISNLYIWLFWYYILYVSLYLDPLLVFPDPPSFGTINHPKCCTIIIRDYVKYVVAKREERFRKLQVQTLTKAQMSPEVSLLTVKL